MINADNMKKYISIAAVAALCAGALLSASCAKENSLTERQLTITATIGDGTKTHIVPGDGVRTVVWSPGDAISLFYGPSPAGGYRFVTENGGAVAQFTGTINAVTGSIESSGEEQFFWGVYPYAKNTYRTANGIHTRIALEQLAVPGTINDSTAVTVARSKGLEMSFKNTNALFAVKFSRDDIYSISMYGKNYEPITGAYEISFDHDGKIVVTPAPGSGGVMVRPADTDTFLPDTWYYFVTLPAVIPDGYYIKFDSMRGEVTYYSPQYREFEISKCYTLTEKDGEVKFPDEGTCIEMPIGGSSDPIAWN